jgi:hypothetical protein
MAPVLMVEREEVVNPVGLLRTVFLAIQNVQVELAIPAAVPHQVPVVTVMMRVPILGAVFKSSPMLLPTIIPE